MGIAINQATTFANIPKFVPFGVLWYTEDTEDLYIGTGASIGPAVTFIAGGGSSGGGGGLNITTAASTNIPSPLYSPSETPAGTNPFAFVQDVNGNWHTQAVVDTTSAVPLPGILTWTRPMFYRDGLSSTQLGKNAFHSINHTMGVNVASNNQDRAMWVTQGNLTGNLISFSIDNNNNVTFTVFANSFGFNWYPGQLVYGHGLTTGTYLNGVTLTIQSATLINSNTEWVIVANSNSFTHAAVGTTSDTGAVDQQVYGGANLQMEMDIQGNPKITGSPDGELRTLSLQFADTTTGSSTTLLNPPPFGIGCLRAMYFREAGAGFWNVGGGTPGVSNAYFSMANQSTVAGGAQQLVNLYIDGEDQAGAANLGYIAIKMIGPVNTFANAMYGLYVSSWPTINNSYAIYIGSGSSYFGGNVTLNGTLTDGAASVGTSGYLLSSTHTGTAWVAPSSLGFLPTAGGTMSGNITLNSTLTDGSAAVGSNGQVLSSTVTGVKWINNPAGFANPMTTAGDIIIENSTPAPARLAIGNTGQVLTVSGGLPSWQNVSLTPPTTSGTGGFWGPNIFIPSATSANAGDISANNKIRAFLITLPFATTCTGVAIQVNATAQTGTVIDVGLYNATTGAGVLNSNGSGFGGSGLNGATAGVKSSTFTQVTIPAGQYYFAWTGTTSGTIGSVNYTIGANSNSSGVAAIGAAINSGCEFQSSDSATSGILPSSLTLAHLSTSTGFDPPLTWFAS